MTTPRVVTVVQARMGSTRLPGKVLADLAGRPMLERQLERLARASACESIVVATTNLADDDAVASLAGDLGYAVTRGSPDDVLARYVQAANEHAADIVVRVTADCPLIDPGVLDRVVHALLEDRKLDYASNTLVRTFPRGLDTEVLTRTALERAHREATDAVDREHVTRYIWRHPDRFRLTSIVDEQDHSDLRWTVDTPLDLQVIREIFDDLYPDHPRFGYAMALEHARAHPALHARNADVEQTVV